MDKGRCKHEFGHPSVLNESMAKIVTVRCKKCEMYQSVKTKDNKPGYKRVREWFVYVNPNRDDEEIWEWSGEPDRDGK